MASSVAVRKQRKHKMRLIPENNDDQMVVKSLSVPPGLEALMEGLTREVLRMQPQDICLFASEHFARLIKMRDAAGDEYQFCKTTIHDKIKQKNVPSRVTTQQPSPKDDVETIDGTSSTPVSVPRLDFGRLTNGVGPEIKRNRSEASTAEIDKIQGGFFESKRADVDVINSQIKERNEHVNTDDKVVSEEEENGTIIQAQLKEDKAESDDVKNIEHDDSESGKTEEEHDDVAKEVNEELAGSKENVESNTVEEDNARKENQIQQEETKDDIVKDNEACENIEKNVVTKESTEISNEKGNVEQKEETAVHDECEETGTTEIANKVEPGNKDNVEENLDNAAEPEEPNLQTRNQEADSNETEKKETGNKPEDDKRPEETESKLETTEEHDDLSDSNDVVTQETEHDIKPTSPVDKVQTSPLKEHTDDGSSLEDKHVPSTEVEQLDGSTEAKLVDENHEEQVEEKNTEHESHTGLEKAVIDDKVSEKESDKTPVHITQAEEDDKTDGVETSSLENGEHNIIKRPVSRADEQEVQNLTIPEISTTVATPTPSEDGSTSADHVTKELNEDVNRTSDDNATEGEKQIKAATKLQSLWRGYSLRKMQKSAKVDNEEPEEDLHKLTTAATVIQALWRGYSFRKAKTTETTGAEAGNITSDEPSAGKEAADVTAEQNIAATKIQSSWRGHNVRKKRHIDMNDAAPEEEHDKKEVEEKPGENVVGNETQSKEIAKETMAATVIQALWRGYAMRKSRNVESASESTQQRTEVDTGTLNLAAAKIQALWRGHNVRKVHNSSTIGAEHEMKDTQATSVATTVDSELDAENKTDTGIVDSDKAESGKVTEVIEPVVEAEKATATESENSVQPSEAEVNGRQDTTIPASGTGKINDTVEPEMEAVKSSEVESGNTAAETRTESDGDIEGVAASAKGDLEDEKAAVASEHAEEVNSVSKTDADVPELYNETAESDKTSDENTETTVDKDGPKSEVQSEVTEKTEPVVKPEEIDEVESEVESEKGAEKTDPAEITDKVKSEVKSEEESQTAEPVVKADEAEDELKAEDVSQTPDSVIKADESESKVKSEKVAEKPEPDIEAEEIGNKDEGEVKSEDDADKTEPLVKADEAEDEVKSEEASQTAELGIKAEEVEGEVKSEKVTEKAEPDIEAEEVVNTVEGVVKSEVAENTEPLVKEDEAEVKSDEASQTAKPVIKTDEAEIKSEEVAEPAVKEEENVQTADTEVKSDEFTETSESVVKPEEIIEKTETEDKAKSENLTELAEPTQSKDISETTENDVKPGEISEQKVKNEELADKVEPSVAEETTEKGESSVSDKDDPETIHSSTTAEEFTDSVKSDTAVIKPEEIANVAEPDIKTEEEINETTEPEAKVEDTETEKRVDAEKDGEKTEDLHEDGGVPVSENITQELAGKVDSSPIETEIELHSDKKMDSAGGEVKETEEPPAVDNNVNKLDESNAISDRDKVSETNDIDKEKIESLIIPESENNTSGAEDIEVKNPDVTETGDNVESSENTIITTPSEDTQSEVEHASEIMKNSDNATTESPQIAVSDAAENKEPESTVTTYEGLKESSSTISEDIAEENLIKLKENVDVKPTDVKVANNAEHTKSLDGTDNEETNKDVNTNASDETDTQDTKNTESDENEQIDIKENVTESLSPHSLDETQGDVDKHDEIEEPEIKKESVKVDETGPTHQAGNSNETTNNIVLDTSSEAQKHDEIDEKSTDDSKGDIKDEPAVSSEVANENKSEIISEPEQKSSDDNQSLLKTENVDHVDTSTDDGQCPEISNDDACEIEGKDNDKQDVTDEKAGLEDSVKEHDAATKIQSTWRGYSVRKSNSIITDGKDPEIASENDNETEDKSSEDAGSKTETNHDEITHSIVDTAATTVEELGTTEENVNESANTDETVEAAKENVAMEISEPLVEKIEHSTVNSENLKVAETNDASEINNKETVRDSNSAEENKLEDTVASNEAVAETKTAEDEPADHVSDIIEGKDDTSTDSAESTVHQETTEKLEETSPSSTDNKAENVAASDQLEDDLEKRVGPTNDAKIREETMNDTCSETTDAADSRAEDHKDTYQASEASTVDIRDVEDSLKSPAHASEAGTDLEINVHEDGEKLNESSDTKNSLDADGKVKFYVGPDETNQIQIVDDGTKEAEGHGNENTESGKVATDEVANEDNSEIHKSGTSVLLSALSDDSDEVEKGDASKETSDTLSTAAVENPESKDNTQDTCKDTEADVPETNHSIDTRATTQADEEDKNNDTSNNSIVNSSVANTEDTKENSPENGEDAKAENINETQDNQAQDSIHNTTENIENDGVKSSGNVANNENEKLNQDDDNQELAVNIQSFDKALSESENMGKESNDVQADTDNADDSVTYKDDIEDTTALDTQNASTIPLVDANTEKTADTIVENNTSSETETVAPLDDEQHLLNSENKSDAVQNKGSTVSPRNLHEDNSSESVTKDSNDIGTKQDTAEVTVPSVEHENIEATTHSLLNTTAADISHKPDSMSPSLIIEEGPHAADNVTNEHESEETHEVSHTPVTTRTAEDMEMPHESSSTVNDEDKHSAVDEVDNDQKNVSDEIVRMPVYTIVADMPQESENKSSSVVNDADENKNIELDETHTPVVTTTADNQSESNEEMGHLEEEDTDKNIEENEIDETTIIPSTEDEGNSEKSEQSEGNIIDIQKNSEANGHVPAASDVETKQPTSEDISVDDKENEQTDTTEDKDAKQSINESSNVEENEKDLISNEETHSALNDMEEENKNEGKNEDEAKIKDIEAQIEHEDVGGTKQNEGATGNEGQSAPLEEGVEGMNEKPAAVTRDDNKTEEDKAAVTIQSAWKGHHVRRTLSEDKELALLQRRTECDELPSSKTDVAEDVDVLSQAATTIQAGARGYLVRKRRHLAKVTDVSPGNAATVDESDSASQATVIAKQADTLDTSQSFGSIENAKSEEENTDAATPKGTQSTQVESKSTAIIPAEPKDVESNITDAEESEADRESSTECRNDNTNGNDVTEIKDVDNEKENVAELKHESSAEINRSAEDHTNKEKESIDKDDKQELDEIDALNQRLHNLSRTNVYQTDVERGSNDKVEDDHKMDSPEAVKMNFDRALSDLHAQTSKSLDDDDSVMTAPAKTDEASKADDDNEHESKPSREEADAENKEVAQILAEPKANTTPGSSVNLDDFDSSKYDLKVEHTSPRSRNTSPVHELTSAAYKIGAAIAVDDEAVVDAMDENAKDKPEEKPVEYIHIPLQGPLPDRVVEKPIEKETMKASQEEGISKISDKDGESPEYIYIPLKPPGTVNAEDEKVDEGSALKENVGDAHTDVDNQKEEPKNEEDTTSRSFTENKGDNEDNLELSVSEHSEYLKTEQTEGKEDNADKSNDPGAELEDKETEENNVKLEEHELAGKEHIEAIPLRESLADHAIEKECDKETGQITSIPEPIPSVNKSSDQVLSNEPVPAELKSSEPTLSASQPPESQQLEKLAETSPEVVCAKPIEKLSTKENLENPPETETKTAELESQPIDSTVSGQTTANATTEKDTDKSLVENTSAQPENKPSELVSSETKTPEPELSHDKSAVSVLEGSKTPEAVHSDHAEATKDDTKETSRTASPVKSTSAIDDIDAFLQRNKARTISRQQNVDSSSHRTLFAEIDSLIDAYGQKRQTSPPTTSHGQADLEATAKIENDSRAQGQQLSVQDELPDVIMANSKNDDVHRAATKIQSAYRGYHTRQQQKAEAQARNEDSSESDKTYTIEKRSRDNASSPDEEVSSEDDGARHRAATKIQTTFREYRKKRSTESNEGAKHVPDEEQQSEKQDISAEHVTKEDVTRVESVEHSNKMSGEEKDPRPDQTSEQVDKNKELEESIENPEAQHTEQPSLVDVNDETAGQKSETSPVKKSANTLEVTTRHTDEKEQVTGDNTPDSLEVHQSHTDNDSLSSKQRHSPERGQVQDLKITKLEDKFLDHAVTNDRGTDARHEELRDISEMVNHDAAIKIQSTYRGFKTRQTLKNNNQGNRSLGTIPEVMSPASRDKERDTNEDTGGNTMNAEEHHAYITGTAVKPHVDSPESCRQNSVEQQYKSTHGVASTSDAWRYQLHHEATTDGDSTAKDETTTGGGGTRNDSTIYDEDDSEPPYGRSSSSPDGKLVQGYQQRGTRHGSPAGLQHSGETHDTLDIFLSSEELSQGAEVLTSRDTSQKDGGDDGTACNVTTAHAQCGAAAKHEGSEQYDGHSVMETAKNNQTSNNTTATTEQQQQQTVADMGNGNTEAFAATKIQAGFRGYQVRKQMKLKKNGSDDAKVVKRCSSGRRRGSLRRGETPKSGTDLEERSATKIQAGIRGFLVRKRQKSTKQ